MSPREAPAETPPETPPAPAEDAGPSLWKIARNTAIVFAAVWFLSEIRDPRPGDILRGYLKPLKHRR